MIILFFITNVVVILVVIVMLIPFNYGVFIIYEFMVIVFLIIILMNSSTNERMISISYLLFFRYVLGIMLILNNQLIIMGLLLLVIGYAKLPLYGLHIWLPKVHVEASIIRSIILAGAVLKIRIIYLWNFNRILLLLIYLLLWPSVLILNINDRKSFIAYSSVLHISCCVLVLIVIMIYIGYIHIVLSPLIFVLVYNMYMYSRSRYYIKIRIIVLILIICNFRFPYLGAFNAELYILTYVRLILFIVGIIYLVVGYVFMKSLNGIRSELYYLPVIVLYLILL